MNTNKFTISMVILLVLIVGMTLMFTSPARAFTMNLMNTSSESLFFRFTWLDCDWPDFPKVTHMWAGEIHPREVLNSGVERVNGPYTISWQSMDKNGHIAETHPFTVDRPGAIYAIPGFEPEFKPAD